MHRELAPGVIQIDTRPSGMEEVTAGFLITGSAPVLVETGSQSSAATVVAALADLGLSPGDLAGVAVTHIHLDHAGGVGDVARAFPNATVYVHEKGARHLADPTRLIASAAQVYGDLLDNFYGRLDPTPADRIHVLADGEEIEVGPGRTLTTVDSPGHAKHHLALHDSDTGILFAGDAVGIKLPGVGAPMRPSTPPADFDYDLALNSLRRFAARRPAQVALAHYGIVGPPAEVLAEGEECLRRWAEEAEKAWRAGEDIAGALGARFAPNPARVAPEAVHKLEVFSGIHSNAAGLKLWLDRRGPSEARNSPGGTEERPPAGRR
jgi:glyoxylase-like metal-dependent hydrolase (beta-lactamase superfamily II)